MKFDKLILAILTAIVFGGAAQGGPSDFVVYGVTQSLPMGNEGEVKTRDFFVNIGSKHGVKSGSKLVVYRQNPSYDLVQKKLHKDVTFPIAHLKVIHVESNAAIARLEKMLPLDETPTITPRAVLVGDIVRRTASK